MFICEILILISCIDKEKYKTHAAIVSASITHNSSDDMGFSKNHDQQYVSLCVAYDVFTFLCNLYCIAVCTLIPISACNDNRVKTVVPFLSFSNILEEERKTKSKM